MVSIGMFLVVAHGFADEGDGDSKGKGKGKGKDAPAAKAPERVMQQLDLNKLPPDLAKQLRAYLDGKGGKGKSAKTEGKAYGTKQLPPGLARKPASHPGRVNWLKAHGLTESAVKGKGGDKKKGKKGGKDDDDD
jgi:hypothetical protein